MQGNKDITRRHTGSIRRLVLDLAMGNVADKHSITFINTTTAAHVTYPVYSIEEFYNEDIKTSGVCILFDVYGDMIEVIASHEDIVCDAHRNTMNRVVDSYCLVVDEEEDLSSDEVDTIFYGIKNNIIDVYNIKDKCSVDVYISPN